MLDMSETLIPLPDAAKLFPPGRGNRPVHPLTLLAWINRGYKSRGGRLVRLEAVKLSGRWLTSGPAIQRFINSLASDGSGAA